MNDLKQKFFCFILTKYDSENYAFQSLDFKMFRNHPHVYKYVLTSLSHNMKN